ncbi:hypothetical protein [Nocardia sp. X0981]
MPGRPRRARHRYRQASGPGTFLQGTTGQGGTTTLSTGGSTPITMRPLTFHDNAATVEIFPGNP